MMLTPTTAAVRFDLPLTPDQLACSMSIDRRLKTFWSLVEQLRHVAEQHQPMDEVEETVFRGLLVSSCFAVVYTRPLYHPGQHKRKGMFGPGIRSSRWVRPSVKLTRHQV